MNLSPGSSYLMRIPVTIKNDNRVSRLQVEPQATSSGTQQEHKVLIGRVIKVLKQHATVLSLSGSYIDLKRVNYYRLNISLSTCTVQDNKEKDELTIQTQVFKITVGKIVLHDGHE